MLIYLASVFSKKISVFNVLHYISFRAIAGLLSSVLISIVLGGRFIAFSGRFFRSKARAWTPDNHRQKDDMPTMGGVFVLGIVILNALLWTDIVQPFVWIFLLSLIGFGCVGFLDDWQKIRAGRGMQAFHKFSLQILVACIIGLLLVKNGLSTSLTLPFLKHMHPDLGWIFLPIFIFVLVGTSNAVNLTDGLDGLAIGSLISNFSLFSLICYLAGNFAMASYLHIPFAATGEIAVIGAIMVGASLGFLWFNAYPAQIFMGDVGSLALGSALALMAIMSKHMLLLPLAGALFVVEAISVIMQVGSYKLIGKKVFKMAPIHHHFELLGWPESRITVRFGIISLILCLMALITLKIR